MKQEKTLKTKDRKNERGAAMVMALLISFLLLVAGAGLILESSMNSANVTDATAEQQAYNAAESGIQSSINVLRGNVVPNPLLDPNKSATDIANQINYRRAVTKSTSNTPSDVSTTARFSRWLTYSSTNADRVVLGAQGGEHAFSVNITDPDNTISGITYSTSGSIGDSGVRKTFSSGLTVTYVPKDTTLITDFTQETDFGKFEVTGSGAVEKTRFFVHINMTSPYNATKVIRGWIEPGTNGTLKLFYDSGVFIFMGSIITLSNGTMINQTNVNPPRVGFEVPLNGAHTNAGITFVSGTMTAAELIRLLIKSTGFGPRGARKQLEAIIQKNFFNDLPAPATLTLVGSNNGFTFKPGTSNVNQYSGDDVISTALIPPIGTTNNENLQVVINSVNGQPPNPYNGTVVGTPSNISAELPFWLQSPANLDTTLEQLKMVARASGRYYPSGVTPPNFGDNATAKGITFVDGNIGYSGAGGGILVVTGQLTFTGGFDFNGLMIITGTGGVKRTGGGSGRLQGNMVIAPYVKTEINSGFKSPMYDISGAGSSDIVYNSGNVASGLAALSNFVLGVAEK